MNETDDLSFDAWRVFGKRYEHKGHEVFYREEGDGPVLLCIHGFPTASWDWHRIWNGLTSHFRVIAPDMIGFGFSAKPDSYDYSVMDQADLHEGLLASLDVDRVTVLAHDLGDTVAQELLARHIERADRADAGPVIRRIGLMNAGLFPETHRPVLMQKLLCSPVGFLFARMLNRERFGKSFAAVFGAESQPTEEELDTFWHLIHYNDGERVAHRIIRYIRERRRHRERWVSALAASPVPLRLVIGMDDPVSGAHMLKRYRELIPEPDVVELAGIGHYPQIEAPEAVLDAMLPFLTQD